MISLRSEKLLQTCWQITLPWESPAEMKDWDSASNYNEIFADDDAEVCGGWLLWSTIMLKFTKGRKKSLLRGSQRNAPEERRTTINTEKPESTVSLDFFRNNNRKLLSFVNVTMSGRSTSFHLLMNALHLRGNLSSQESSQTHLWKIQGADSEVRLKLWL